jgi:hypothetical protein
MSTFKAVLVSRLCFVEISLTRRTISPKGGAGVSRRGDVELANMQACMAQRGYTLEVVPQ